MAFSRVVVLIVLSGCDTLETGVDFFTDHGDVYECQATATDVLELCTQLSEAELERATSWTCEPTSRLWPRVFGCVYRCGAGVPPGCNARSGCFCPE